MEKHHTKNKGDLGFLKVCTDLHIKEFDILIPLSEHLPYDLVAHKDDRFLRVQVKYRKIDVRGRIAVYFRSVSTFGKAKRIDRNKVDVWAIYCPDTEKVYYLYPKSYKQECVILRPPLGNTKQRKGVRNADDFLML